MKNWIVKAMQQDGTWLQWSSAERNRGYWSNHQTPMLMEKQEAVEMAKRIFTTVDWAYGVKIVEDL